MISPRRKRNFIIVTFFLVILVSLLIGEIVIRIYHSTCDRKRFIWIPDYYIGYAHTPNNVFFHNYTEEKRISVKHKTNSFRLLGEEIPFKKEKGTFRILVLGDSYTEALQVSAGDNFCGQLQNLLNNNLNKKYKKYEVLNAGISGYSPISHYLYFKRELVHLEPDMVIVQLFGNDVFEDNEVRAKSLLDRRGLPLRSDKYFTQEYVKNNVFNGKNFDHSSLCYRITRFLIDKSRFFEYCYVKIINVKKQSPIHQKMIRVDQFGTGNQFFILDPEHHLNKNEEFRNRAWSNTQKYINALRDLAKNSRSKFVLFYIPMESQLKLDSYGDHTSLYLSHHIGTYFNNLLEEFSQENNIHFLDMLPYLEKNKHERLYLNKDGHLTVKGHSIVAQTLFNDIFTDEK